MELGEIEADEIDSLLEEEGINEDLLFIGAKKIKQIFDKATNGEVKLKICSVMCHTLLVFLISDTAIDHET